MSVFCYQDGGGALVTRCTAPTAVTLDAALIDASAATTLRWTGAAGGAGNPIRGYEVYRDGALLATVLDGASITVTASGTMGAAYRFTVKTLGQIPGFDSGISTASATLTAQTYSTVGAPSNLSVSATNVGFGQGVTLSWSGAKAGTNNPITGYEIWRATSASGTYSRLTSLATSATSGSVSVTSPASNASYYYKVKTLGTKSGFADSGLSGGYATLTSKVTAPTAPASVWLSAADVRIGKSVTLSWSGSKAGTNNPIAKYHVYRNGAYLTETAAMSCTVTASGTAGAVYTYTVYSIGSVSGWNSGASGGVNLTAHGAESTISYFTSSGAYAVPSWAQRLDVCCIGGGGGAASTGYNYGGSNVAPGGGGGGASGEIKNASYTSSQVTPGSSIQITVGGAGGGATYSPSSGGPGGASSFGALLSARGGEGGQAGGGTNATYPNGGNGGSGGICGAGGGWGRNGPNSTNIGRNGSNGTSWGIPASDAAYYVFGDASTNRRLGRGGRGGTGQGGGNAAQGNDTLPGTRYGQGGDGNNGNGGAGIVAVRAWRYLS